MSHLRNNHKIKAAAALLASLENRTPLSAEDSARQNGLAKERIPKLRECYFSMGGLTLARRVIDRFLAMPEVRLFLSESSKPSCCSRQPKSFLPRSSELAHQG